MAEMSGAMTPRSGAVVLGPPVQPYTAALMRAAKILTDRTPPGEEMPVLLVEHVDPAGKLLLAASRASTERELAGQPRMKARILIRHSASCAVGLQKSQRRGTRPNCRCTDPQVDIVEPTTAVSA